MKTLKDSTIRVRSSNGDYLVICQRGVSRKAQKAWNSLGEFSGVHIVSSAKVWKHAAKHFGRLGDVDIHLFEDSEEEKNLATVEQIARSLLHAGADRRALIVAVGGGVIGDVAGFVAATYLRGVSFIQVPTTLVAQLDSSIGGKTGVNLPEGKNMVGAFYPPRMVLVDPEVLATLPEREFRSGLAEVIKYGVVADRDLFEFLEENMTAIVNREPAALQTVIKKCIEIKVDVVSRDERESGLREILNYGHTFGHALEAVTEYKVFLHGEAVAWGMMCAALLGYSVGVTPAEAASRIVALSRKIGPLPKWPKTAPAAIHKAMLADKKIRKGKLRFILATKIGKAITYDNAPEEKVLCVLKYGPDLANKAIDTLGKCDG